MFQSKGDIDKFISYRQRLIANRKNISLPKNETIELHRSHVLMTDQRMAEITKMELSNSQKSFKNMIENADFTRPDELYDLPDDSHEFNSITLNQKLASIKEEYTPNETFKNAEQLNTDENERKGKFGFWSTICCNRKKPDVINADRSRG